MNIEYPNEDKRNQLNTSVGSIGSIKSIDEFSDDDSESNFQPGPLGTNTRKSLYCKDPLEY